MFFSATGLIFQTKIFTTWLSKINLARFFKKYFFSVKSTDRYFYFYRRKLRIEFFFKILKNKYFVRRILAQAHFLTVLSDQTEKKLDFVSFKKIAAKNDLRLCQQKLSFHKKNDLEEKCIISRSLISIAYDSTSHLTNIK